MGEWIKQSITYPYTGIMLRNKKEQNIDTYAKVNKSKKLCWMKEARWENIHIVWSHLYKTLEKTPLYIMTESRSVIASGWRHGRHRRGKLQRGLRVVLGVMDVFTILRFHMCIDVSKHINCTLFMYVAYCMLIIP